MGMNMGEKDNPRLMGGDKLIEEYSTKGHANVMEFAKFLNMIEPRRSIHAWRIAVTRWMKKNEKTVEDLQNIGEQTTDDTWSLMDGYYYDATNSYTIVGIQHLQPRKEDCHTALPNQRPYRLACPVGSHYDATY